VSCYQRWNVKEAGSHVLSHRQVEGASEKCTEWNTEPSVTIALQSRPGGELKFCKKTFRINSARVREQYTERLKISELQVL